MRRALPLRDDVRVAEPAVLGTDRLALGEAVLGVLRLEPRDVGRRSGDQHGGIEALPARERRRRGEEARGRIDVRERLEGEEGVSADVERLEGLLAGDGRRRRAHRLARVDERHEEREGDRRGSGAPADAHRGRVVGPPAVEDVGDEGEESGDPVCVEGGAVLVAVRELEQKDARDEDHDAREEGERAARQRRGVPMAEDAAQVERGEAEREQQERDAHHEVGDEHPLIGRREPGAGVGELLQDRVPEQVQRVGQDENAEHEEHPEEGALEGREEAQAGAFGGHRGAGDAPAARGAAAVGRRGSGGLPGEAYVRKARDDGAQMPQTSRSARSDA